MQGIEKLNVYLLFRTDMHRVILTPKHAGLSGSYRLEK